MGKSIVRWDLLSGQEAKWSSAPPPPPHRRDESAASYSSAGCTPALPDSASLAGFILKHTAATVNTHDDTDRKSTRLNSSHLGISYAVFCLKKKKKTTS